MKLSSYTLCFQVLQWWHIRRILAKKQAVRSWLYEVWHYVFVRGNYVHWRMAWRQEVRIWSARWHPKVKSSCCCFFPLEFFVSWDRIANEYIGYKLEKFETFSGMGKPISFCLLDLFDLCLKIATYMYFFCTWFGGGQAHYTVCMPITLCLSGHVTVLKEILLVIFFQSGYLYGTRVPTKICHLYGSHLKMIITGSMNTRKILLLFLFFYVQFSYQTTAALMPV